MIIRKPHITEENGEIIVSARVELETKGIDAPDTIEFAFPKGYRDHVTDRADGFAVAVLASAMALGEDLVVEGTVSPRLAFGLREYQQVQHHWRPDNFSIIEMTFGEIAGATFDAPARAVGTTLSGGVDSLYSMWQHRPKNEPLRNYGLTHVMIINGFDFDVYAKDADQFQRLLKLFDPLIKKEGLELLPLRSNLRRFRMATRQGYKLFPSEEIPLVTPVLLLGGLFSRFYIPGSGTYTYEGLAPTGSHPMLVSSLSTETLQMIPDGHDASRTEKIAAIAEWEDTYEILRVCWRQVVFNKETGMVENCGRCEKCVRTMLALDLLGVLARYKTFPEPLRRRSVWWTKYAEAEKLWFYRQNMTLAKKAGRHDRVFDLRLARLLSRCRELRSRIIGNRKPPRR